MNFVFDAAMVGSGGLRCVTLVIVLFLVVDHRLNPPGPWITPWINRRKIIAFVFPQELLALLSWCTVSHYPPTW
jgi:hypothetical protein